MPSSRVAQGTAPPAWRLTVSSVRTAAARAGLTWSRIRSIGTGMTTGQVLWDRVGKVLIAQNSEVDTSAKFSLKTLERRSYDL